MSAVIEQPANLPATASDVRAHVQLIQQVMKEVMKDGTHYGVIPGTQKPTLYKAGSEVLLTTFRIAVEPKIEDLSTPDEIRYRVHTIGRHQTTGIVIGEGIGESSSSEEKYRWRKSVCDEEFEQTPIDRRREKWARGRQNSVYTTKQVRTSPADVANTVLKMAKKRAQIDLTLTALAASDIFTQDLEDATEEMRETIADEGYGADTSRPAAQEPQSKGGNGKATEKQQKLISVKLSQAGVPESELLAHFELGTLAEIPFDKVNEALEFIKQKNNG